MYETLRKLYRLFSKRDKRKFFLLMVSNIINALFSLVGISAIVPFVMVFSNPKSVFDSGYLTKVYNYFEFTDVNKFVIYLGVTVLTVFIFSNTVLTIVTWINLKFVRMLSYTLSLRLFKKYIGQNYEYFLKKNSADLTKNIFIEVANVIGFILTPLVTVVSRGIFALSIILLLFVVNPQIAITATLVLGGIYGAFFLVIRRTLLSAGENRVNSNTKRYKVASESFGGIKDIKLLGNEYQYVSEFSKHSYKFETTTTTVRALGALPKYVLECLAFGGMLAIALFLFSKYGESDKTLPLIALYAFAGYRIMPALQDVYKSATELKATTFSLELIYADLLEDNTKVGKVIGKPEEAIEPITLARNIELNDINFSYAGTNAPTINNLNVKIQANSTVGFVGTTGCGKTTTIDLILGLLKPQEGTLFVDGQAITEDNLKKWHKIVGYVPQDIYLKDDTIKANIAFGAMADDIDMDAVIQAAKAANIYDHILNKLDDGFDTFVGERGVRLSGGQKQRIGIARALYHNPSVLVMDEATSALDGSTEHKVMKAVNDLAGSKTIIIIAHRLETVKKCDVVHIMDAGRIVESGTFEELTRKSQYFSKIEFAHQ